MPIALAAGCIGHLQPATATFRGIERPIVLGPVDRIGGATPATPRTLGRIEGEATSSYSRSESRGANVVTTTEEVRVENAQLYRAALDALAAAPDASIRVTRVRLRARGFITFVKNAVAIRADVVGGAGSR